MHKEYKAKISYTIKETHPDKDYVVGGWSPDKVFDFEDKYFFNTNDYSEEEIMAIIKDDLRLVAGGGYNWNHIDNIKFLIEEVI